MSQQQSGKLMPNLDQQTTKLLNLTVLQRIDPFVEEILITAAHVTFYEFNIDLSQWVRHSLSSKIQPLNLFLSLSLIFLFDSFAEPQGRWRISLRRQEVRILLVFGFFLVLVMLIVRFRDDFCVFLLCNFRNTQPRFQFIVMNRRNTG